MGIASGRFRSPSALTAAAAASRSGSPVPPSSIGAPRSGPNVRARGTLRGDQRLSSTTPFPSTASSRPGATRGAARIAARRRKTRSDWAARRVSSGPLRTRRWRRGPASAGRVLLEEPGEDGQHQRPPRRASTSERRSANGVRSGSRRGRGRAGRRRDPCSDRQVGQRAHGVEPLRRRREVVEEEMNQSFSLAARASGSGRRRRSRFPRG